MPVVLIAVVVLWPVVEMIRSSFLKISRVGVVRGSNGLDNYKKLFDETDFADIMVRSVIWVVAVVALTVLISLALAQLFNQRFPGRKVARWALIAPWAASVLMTAIVFKWMLDPEVGVINQIRLEARPDRRDGRRLGRPARRRLDRHAVAGVRGRVRLAAVHHVRAAGRSGRRSPATCTRRPRWTAPSRWRTYWSITLPLLRPALTVAALINVMNVFNSFPIIWAMTHGRPGYSTATSTILMFILKGSDIGESAAMSVVNFGMVVVLTAIFLKVSRWNRAVA